MRIPDELLHDYGRWLDGELTTEQAAKLSAYLDAHPAARSECERLGQIETELRQMFSPTTESPPALTTHPPSDRRSEHKHRRKSRRTVLYPLLVLLVATALLVYRPTGARIEAIDGQAIYAAFIANDQPDIVCDTPEKFLEYTSDKLGESITAQFGTPVALIGWRGTGFQYDSDADTILPRVLLARDGREQPIVVIFQPRRFPEPSLPASSGLHRFSKPLGSVTAWEVSSNDEPSVLALISRDLP